MNEFKQSLSEQDAYLHRLTAVRKLMKQKKVKAALIFSRENTRYLAGFAGSESYLFITAKEAFILVDFRYLQQAAQQSPHFKVIDHTRQRENALQPLLDLYQAQKLAVETDAISYRLARHLVSLRKDLTLVSFEDELDRLRSVKDDLEIECMQQASRMAEQALQETLPLLRPGNSEIKIAAALEEAMRRQGAEGPAFDTIVASGPRSALPHGLASQRTLGRGDAVVIDFGCTYRGYRSDMTRTFFIESVDPEQQKVYETVLKAQKEALARLRADLLGSDADAVARNVIDQAGYGKHFGHGLGHGVGLAIHESPRLARPWQKPLLPGQVVTVEPGIYLDGKFGVRIEDMAVIEKDGHRNFNHFDKALQVLG